MTDNAVRALADLPWPAHAAVFFALGAGLVLWLSGHRYLRPTFVLAGLLLGLMTGYALPPTLRLNAPQPYALGIGAGVGALLGWLCFRVCVAASLSVILGLLSPLITVAVLHLPMSGGDAAPDVPLEQPAASVEPTRGLDAPAEGQPTPDQTSGHAKPPIMGPPYIPRWAEAAAQLLRPIPLALDQPDAPDAAQLASVAQRLTETTHAGAVLFLEKLADTARPIWNELPRRTRLALSVSTGAGVLIGLCAGLALPRRATAITTAFLGPAIWLPAGVYLMHAFNVPLAGRLPAEPAAWLGVWALTAVIGLVIQWTRSKPAADKA